MELKIGDISLPVTVNETELKSFLLSNLFKFPDKDIIFQVDKEGIPHLGGNRMSIQDVLYWKERIDEFVKTPVWNMLSNTLVEICRKHMFENSKSYTDVEFGKAMLYVVDLQQKILQAIQGVTVPVQPPPMRTQYEKPKGKKGSQEGY